MLSTTLFITVANSTVNAANPPQNTVTGQNGDANQNNPGWYGTNAATNFQALLANNPAQAGMSSIRFSPQTQAQNAGDYKKNAFGYAIQDIARLDGNGAPGNVNGNGTIEAAEVTHAFTPLFGAQNAALVAAKFMQALDGNQDGHVDAIENAAYLMFQDANNDGVVSPQEIGAGNNAVLGNPANTRTQINNIITNQGLAMAYATFLAQMIAAGFEDAADAIYNLITSAGEGAWDIGEDILEGLYNLLEPEDEPEPMPDPTPSMP